MRLHLVVPVVLSLSLVAATAFAGGAITSGVTGTGTISGPSFIESWTFSGTSGQRVLINAITTTGALNTTIVLKQPGGSIVYDTVGGDILDYQLNTSGTFTIEVQDIGLNDTGTYAINFTNITAGPLSGGGDTDGGAIVSADVKTGTISGPADMDCFTFTGQQGNRVLIDAVATAGAGFDTYMILYPPNGGAYATYTVSDLIDFQLTANGTWIVVVEDNNADVTGSYSLSFMNLGLGPISNGSDTDGGPINSDQILSGQMQQGVDFDAFTFSGFAGSRVLVTGVATSGSLNTNLTLYPPGGGAAITYSSGNDYLDWQLPLSGTYTIIVTDVGLDSQGNYTISMNNVTTGPFTSGGDPDGGEMSSSDVKNGTISGTGDEDVYTFQGNFGDRVILSQIETSGAGFNAQMILYPPAGGGYLTSTSSNRLEYQLPASGTYSIVIQDLGFDTGGGYSFSLLNVTAGPLSKSPDNDGGTLASNDIKNGTMQQAVDTDAFTFTGVAGHRVYITGVTTGGGANNTDMYLYPPGGGNAESQSSSDYMSVQLAASGTYTLVMADLGSDNTGTYTVSMVDLTAGPYTNGGDPDGGAITSAGVKSGSISGVGDLDCYTFTGNAGDRILISTIEKSGAGFNSVIQLFPPTGGDYVTYALASRLDWQLSATGTWTIMVYDNNFDNAGTYDISLLNITSGPLTGGSDADGGAIASDGIKGGQFQQGADFDAYTFTGMAGHRVFITAVATGGGSQNTNLYLYPPNGGAYETTNSVDYLDWSLLGSGTYTIVVEDVGNDDAGTYTISMVDLTGGPYTSGGDPDGGPLTSAAVRTGTSSGVGDLDVYTFAGTAGQHVLIDAQETAGAGYTAYIALYPPNGQVNYTYATNGRLDTQLNASGTWSVMIYDNGFDTGGSYEMSFLNIQAGPFTTGGDPDGGAIGSDEIKTGSFQQATDFDTYTFSGVAGQRVVLVAVATGGGAQNTNISLYPPTGGGSEVNTQQDRTDVQLQRTGTYTMVVEEYNKQATGGYVVSYVNLGSGPFTGGGDTNGGNLVSNQLVTGTMSGVGDTDTYQFYATNGQRILCTAVETSGVNFNTQMYLYPPGGFGTATSGAGNQIDYQVTASGVWTLCVDDNGEDTAGGYALAVLNLTGGPYSGSGETDGGALTDNVGVAGSIGSFGDTDGYTFYGLAGRTANISAIATSGTLDTQIVVYPPNGGYAIINTTTDTAAPVLAVDGYYTLVIEDYANDNTGNYTVKVHQTGVPVTGVGDTPPAELALHPGAPSPFSQSTRIAYDLPSADHVRIGVYDVTGARIRSLVDENRSGGRFAATWDGRDDAGRRVASGVYYLRMETKTAVQNQKVVLVR